jgi:hypothetical protein
MFGTDPVSYPVGNGELEDKRQRHDAAFVQEAGWAPGPVWAGAEKSRLPPPGFDPQTVLPVPSRKNYAIRPTDTTHLLSSAEVMNACNCVSILLYAFMY